ncbi:lipase family protein [Nonomuraea gerenzanensis]|uniref:Triacylglycerol lipase n=1 Tax=Nonomuraea gerenzanensis TaxID=93944 RepID=A0A1M4E673_9ACTN|nr:lipase family protein [Nonomuraea gerenzanensis]UBU16524.1 lipase family protein [Nonomuraea gerenzanensis]SBO94349.1 Triacylglycerol lipase precursor [Nonomuraea gerenzanensis]
MTLRVRVSMSMILLSIMSLLVAGPARAAAPGDVVSAQPTTVYLLPGQLLEVPVNAWHLRYNSTSATGAVNTVSGTLLVPKAGYPLGTRPIIGYAFGTHGLGDQCAPSAGMQRGGEAELALVSLFLLKGYAVAMTDYEGLGTPGQHTYMVGISQGHAVLDAIRAASRVPGAGLSAGAPVGIMGYSQGGASAAWAAQLQPSYAPELRLRGVAAGGVPADLRAVAQHLDGSPDFGLAAAAGIGLDAAYPELDLEADLNDRGRALLADAADDCVGDLSKLAGLRFSDLSPIDLLNQPKWLTRLAENRLGAVAPRVPVFLYHARGDQIIPLAVGSTLRTEYCRAGARVRWLSLPAPDHVTGAIEGGPPAIEWLALRILGLPASSNC